MTKKKNLDRNQDQKPTRVEKEITVMRTEDSVFSVVPGYIKVIVGSGLAILLLITGAAFLWETNVAGYTVICQAPFTGNLQVVSTPGAFWQGGGTVTIYKQACTISFGGAGEDGNNDAPAVWVQFNDNGKAEVFGNARFQLPPEEEKMRYIHTQYRSYEHLVDTLLERVTAETLVLTAQMFSSEDTYSGSRAEYQRLAQDQLEHGKYQTVVSEQEIEDPITHEKRRVKKVEPKKDSNGNILRLVNPLDQFGIKITQLIIDQNFKYEPGILSQMEKQREANLQMATARTMAMKASQQALTAEAEGKAAVITAEYEKLVEKKRATVEAQQKAEIAKINAEQLKTVAEVTKQQAEIEANMRLQVAETDKKAAEATKQREILLGEGEASRKAAVMAADGALEMKLRAYFEVNRLYAQAIENYKGNWVPQISMGANGTTGTNSASDMVQLLMAKTAKDLALDLTNQTIPVKNDK